MTNHSNRGAARPNKPWRLGLCAAVALLAMQAPLSHAADAFGGAAKPSKELTDRLEKIEKQLSDIAARAAAQPSAPPAGDLNLPTPPGMPPLPIADEELALDYEIKGELNGSVIVVRAGRVSVMPRAEFDNFAAQSKARARLKLTKDAAAGATPPGAPGAPGAAPLNTLATKPGLPPVPAAPQAAPAPAPAAPAATPAKAAKPVKANPGSATAPANASK